MSSADWPQVDPMPSMVSSTDLFDGDILGDELIDIYNAAVVGGSDDDAINEIPSLLGATPDEKKDEQEFSHPGADLSTTTIDDGLGAFRPSTSFNDFTTLLSPSTTAVGTNSTAPVAPIASSTSIEQSKATYPKKRSGPTLATEAPAAKRRVIGSKTNNSTASMDSKGSTKAKCEATSTDKTTERAVKQEPTGVEASAQDTPNPLSSGVAQAESLVVPNPQTVKVVQPGPANGPAVVSPRPPPKVKAVPAVTSASGTDQVPPQLPLGSGTNSSSSAAQAATEADFKSVAQAAVTSLIINAGTVQKSDVSTTDDESSGKVDTSTEHIKALTGSNWVAVCAGGNEGTQPVSAVTTDKVNNRARRQNLTPDERARQNRDRNREHARNTRLRKKAYVEELKRTLTELVAQRDAADLEKRHAAQRELEQREVRFRVIEEFLKLRGRNEANFARWAAILEDNFSLILPLTDYRKMVHNTPVGTREPEQVLTGVSDAMADSGHFTSFLQTLVKESDSSIMVSFTYNCDRKIFFMDGCNAVLDWTGTSSGAVQKGAPAELTLKGSVRAKFSPASNKLISAHVTFDTGLIVKQLSRLSSPKAEPNEDVEAVAAAQNAANAADAILDSLQMPHIESAVPTNVTVVPPSSGSSSGASVASLDKEDSSDESMVEGANANATGMTTRRVQRRKN